MGPRFVFFYNVTIWQIVLVLNEQKQELHVTIMEVPHVACGLAVEAVRFNTSTDSLLSVRILFVALSSLLFNIKGIKFFISFLF